MADRGGQSPQTANLAGGFLHNVGRYVERVSGSPSLGRFVWEGTVFNLVGWLPTVMGSVLRGMAYRSVLGEVGKGCFIEKGVRWQVPRRVFLGQRVMVGEQCFVDANSLASSITLQDDVWLSRGCYLVAGPAVDIVIGPQTYIGHRSLLYGHGGIRMGRDVLLANDVQLVCGNHTFARRDLSIRAQPTEERPIVIEDDVWLGASAIVLGGVTIGRGSVIAAGSIVTHSLPPYSIARGVPAQLVGVRGEDAPGAEAA